MASAVTNQAMHGPGTDAVVAAPKVTWSEKVVSVPLGTLTLVGILTVPDHIRCATAMLIVPGGPQNRTGSSRRFVDLARQAGTRGVVSLRIDLAGMGDSAGPLPHFEAAGPSLAASVAYLLAFDAAINAVALWGLCDGGTAAILSAVDCLGVSVVIVVNGWARTPAGAAGAMLQTHYRSRIVSFGFWRSVLRGEVAIVAGLVDLLRTIGTRHAQSNGNRQCSSCAPGRDPEQQSLPARIVSALGHRGYRLLVISGMTDPTGVEFHALLRRYGVLAPEVDRGAFHVASLELPDADHIISDPGDWQRAVDASLAFVTASLGYGRAIEAQRPSSSCAQSTV